MSDSVTTPTKLYLTDRSRYRVRTLDGAEVVAVWHDARFQFEVNRGADRRTVDFDRIGAVAEFVQEGRVGIPQWVPWDACYRARHRPAPKKPAVAWRHPYRRAA